MPYTSPAGSSLQNYLYSSFAVLYQTTGLCQLPTVGYPATTLQDNSNLNSPMRELPILRNHPRLHSNYRRRANAPHRNSHNNSRPRPSKAKTHSPPHLRPWNLRHHCRPSHENLLSSPITHILRVHELVLPRSNRRDARHKSTISLVATSRNLPCNSQLDGIETIRSIQVRSMDLE